ncbi:Sodium channel protein Nach [Ooceraea biroi]|uniref:Sodium channel protein Nach n=1 Tax=Ooceraea biroi TaxID=2015173 RepID=A0A026VZU9_OOCBI|nr:Sodium channel protein Nach [Ooceraea biroi]
MCVLRNNSTRNIICFIQSFLHKIFSEISFNAKVTDLPVDEILTLVSQLGNHYVSDFRTKDRNAEIDELLTTYYKEDYDITQIMKTLSPQCSQILLKCKLHGTYRNCSQLFDFRKTQNGFCCTFNYMREKDDILENTEAVIDPSLYMHKVDDLGIERGLTVVMDPLLDDYFYPILPTIGWKVIVFNPQDYPDVASGGVTEVFAIPSSETYIDVTPASFFSTKDIEKFSFSKRKCVFPNEMRTRYSDTSYTYSDCIVDCRLHDMQSLCGCRPFYFPRRGIKDYSVRVCTNADLKCLTKYKTKWWTVFPHDSKEKIGENVTWALSCHNCYPACEDISYDVMSTKSYMSPGTYRTNLLWNVNITNQAVLHIFFSKYGSIRLKQDVSSYWYEFMSNIGGICGVFIGFSLISVVEFLYFIALILRDLLREDSSILDDDHDDHDDHKDKIQSVPCENIQTIYWSELMPRSWQAVKYGQFPKNRARY